MQTQILIGKAIYFEQVRPRAMYYNNVLYLYVLNLQGDVIRIVNTTGATMASYVYDAWGKVISSSGTLANVNPLRYRGYYYDTETRLYYLQSRYYDPEVKRFVNADSAGLITTNPYSLSDKNLFAYCDNNPVMRFDDGGEFWKEVLTGIAIVAGIVAITALTVATSGVGLGAMSIAGGGFALSAGITSTGATALAVFASSSTVAISAGYYAKKVSNVENFSSPNVSTRSYGSNIYMSKGGKQNIYDTGLAGLTNAEIDQLLRDPHTSKREKQRLKKEQKARGTRNKKKRTNHGRDRVK